MDWKITIVASVISGLFSGTLAWLASVIYHRKAARKQMKFDALRELAGRRYDVLGDLFTRSLNQLFVVFNDSEKVRLALKRFHENRVSGPSELANSHLVELFRAMCDDVGIKYSDFTDEFFLRPFNTKQPEVIRGTLPSLTAGRAVEKA